MTVLPDYSFSWWAVPYSAGAVVTLVLLIEVLRIPFRRTYHNILAFLTCTLCAFSVNRAVAANANTPAAYHPLSVLALYLVPLELALVYHLFVAYTHVTPGRALRYSVFASYGVMLLFWGALIVDQSVLIPGAVKTPLGLYADSPGPLEPLVLVYYFAVFAASTVLLVRFYARLPRNVVKRQTAFLFTGAVITFSGEATLILSRDFPIPPLDWFLAPIGIAVMVVGFRKHGFAFVTAAEEVQSSAPPRYSIPVGHSYLAVEHQGRGAFETFTDLITHGHPGLCVSRVHPDNVKQEYDLRSTPVRWLAQSASSDAIAPTDLVGLSLTVKAFLQKGSSPVVILQGLEYLVTNNGYAPALTFVQRINDVVAETRGILIIPVEPRSLSEREEALLASECTRLPESQDGAPTSRGVAVGRGSGAIMFADLVGFSAMVQKDERAALATLDEEQRLIRKILPQFKGREVKSLGDGMLVEFQNAVLAVACSIAIQRATEESNSKSAPERRFGLRIGINEGEVVYKDGDLLGDTVNMASRIEEVARAGETCVSERVYNQVRDKLDCGFDYLGVQQFKNIQPSVGVYRVGRSTGKSDSLIA